MDRFDAMKAFARVVETGSFTKAAQTLHLSRTSATQYVQQLEARLNVRLLTRTTRGVSVTDAGAAYYERVIRLLAELDDAEREVSDVRGSIEGRVRVDLPSPLASSVLIPAMPTFMLRHPNLRVDMRVSDRYVDLLDENIDCAIRGGPVVAGSVIARRIGELKLRAFASPGYLDRVGAPTHPSDLERPPHTVVGFVWAHRNEPFPYEMRRGGETHRVRGNYGVAVDDGNAYLAAGLEGLGIVWLPGYLSRELQDRGALLPVLTEWDVDTMPLHAAYHASRRTSSKVRAFVDWAAETLRDIH